MGAKTFEKLRGDTETLFSSESVFLFGYAMVKIGSQCARTDSRDFARHCFKVGMVAK